MRDFSGCFSVCQDAFLAASGGASLGFALLVIVCYHLILDRARSEVWRKHSQIGIVHRSGKVDPDLHVYLTVYLPVRSRMCLYAMP